MRPSALALYLIIPLMIFTVVIGVIEIFDIDRKVEEVFYDRASETWPLKSVPLLQKVLHDNGRDLIAVIGIGALVTYVLGRTTSFRPVSTRAALYLFVAIAASTAIVGIAKNSSLRPCPWYTTWYGGSIPHEGLFDLSQAKPGRCFPAAHASAGFSLFAFYFIALGHGRRRATYALIVALLCGSIFSAVQIVRGAHFLSHGIWSAMICWLVCLALYAIPFRQDLSSPCPVASMEQANA